MIRFSHSFYRTIIFLSILSLHSCDNSLEDDKRFAEEKLIESYIASKGLKFTRTDKVYHVTAEPSYGYEVNTGDTVKFWFKGYTPESTPLVFDTNIKFEAIAAKLDTNTRTFEPIRVIAGKTDLVEGLKRGLLGTRLNQKSTIIFTSDIGFKSQIMGPLPAWSALAYEIEVIYVNGNGIQTEKEILSTMDLSGFNLHSSGLYYKYLTDPSAVKPISTSTVYGWYRCTLPDGTLVEEVSSNNAQLNLNTSIGALKVGFTLLSVGGSAEFVAPSPMCYGKKGNTTIEPYQPLLFSMRLDSIK